MATYIFIKQVRLSLFRVPATYLNNVTLNLLCSTCASYYTTREIFSFRCDICFQVVSMCLLQKSCRFSL